MMLKITEVLYLKVKIYNMLITEYIYKKDATVYIMH